MSTKVPPHMNTIDHDEPVAVIDQINTQEQRFIENLNKGNFQVCVDLYHSLHHFYFKTGTGVRSPSSLSPAAIEIISSALLLLLIRSDSSDIEGTEESGSRTQIHTALAKVSLSLARMPPLIQFVQRFSNSLTAGLIPTAEHDLNETMQQHQCLTPLVQPLREFLQRRRSRALCAVSAQDHPEYEMKFDATRVLDESLAAFRDYKELI
eukprot:gnl/Dysnectes_brevis/4019_a5245_984.p1 GENE.gnl/Dysnectes_brevis/4019_a5245_984~~gnl/Dysnectes_brevis/4019_a5245_984.p1  ORF type:complete len:208 (-),score=28.62 gnl/Dysnectes_brevis/4019_a5245_984:20-643(-)